MCCAEESPYALVGVGEKKRVDPQGMLERVYRYPEDLEDAAERYMGREISLPREPKGIVVLGMGGSAIGGLFIRDLVYESYGSPVLVEPRMRLPRYVDDGYLVITVSYSGNTEETLRGLRYVLDRGISPICISSDGFLEKIADRRGLVCYKLPPGLPPRVSFPYMAVALLSIFENLGLSHLDELRRAIERLRSVRRRVFESLSREGGSEISVDAAGEGGVREHIVDIVCGATPLVYSYTPYVSPGYRAKTQFNENAKLHAFYGELPEVNHNEIMGWDCWSARRFKPVLLRGAREDEAMRHRIEFLEEYWREIGARALEIKVGEDSLLAELLELFFTVDALSVVTAIRRGVDPTPVETIARLKKYLAEKIPPGEYLSGLLDA